MDSGSLPKNGYAYEVAYAWAEQEVSPVDGVTTDQWCEKNNVQRCDTLAELCEKSDCILILAPSNPETHLRYASEVLKYGKRTYIDKTFAPCLEDAQEIFALAEAYHVPFFSSALRYAEELNTLDDISYLTVTAGGRSLEEYVIHPIEMIVKTFQEPITKVCGEAMGNQRLFTMTTDSGKIVKLFYADCLPFAVWGEKADGTSIYAPIESSFFQSLIEDILKLYEFGTVSFAPAQTLEVMRIRDAVLKANNCLGSCISIL